MQGGSSPSASAAPDGGCGVFGVKRPGRCPLPTAPRLLVFSGAEADVS